MFILKNLANKIYKGNTEGNFDENNFINQDIINIRKNGLDYQRQKRSEESSLEYKQKMDLIQKKERQAKLRKIYTFLKELSGLSQEEIRILLLISFGKISENEFNDMVNLFKASLEGKNVYGFIQAIINKDLSSYQNLIKNNLSKLEIGDLCNYLNINPELNFSKKGQLINDLINMIKSDLANDSIDRSHYPINSSNIKELIKKIYIEVYI